MSDCPPDNISVLIEKCVKGDGRAWDKLVDMIAPVIFSLCKKSKLSRDESFDIYGQVCLELVNSIGRLKSPEKIIYFVATMTRRKIYGFYKKMRVTEYLDSEISELIPDAKNPRPDTLYENMKKREWLMEAMLKLPEKEYNILKALFFDPRELSYQEISDMLKIPVSSIGPIRGKALESLKRILRRKRPKF